MPKWKADCILNDPKSTAWKKKQEKWADFAGKSTCAAMTHLGDESQPAKVKIVWKATLVTGIVMMVISTYFSVSSFLDMAGSSEMVLKSLGSAVEHPNYHICTSDTFNQTILKGWSFLHLDCWAYLKCYVR